MEHSKMSITDNLDHGDLFDEGANIFLGNLEDLDKEHPPMELSLCFKGLMYVYILAPERRYLPEEVPDTELPQKEEEDSSAITDLITPITKDKFGDL